MQRLARWPLAAALLLLLTSCTFADGTPVSEADRRAGAEQHPLILAELGGAYSGDEAEYLERVGRKMAAGAGLEDQCTFTLVNSDVVNAFAVPGCYIYLTRGLMGLMNSEDELASVLAHEVGHIAGEHIEEQQRRMALRSLGVAAIASLTGSERLTRLAGAAAAYFTLRYSRKHEYQADALGLLYLQRAGYDLYAARDMLAALERHSRLANASGDRDPARSIPEWALTHPYTENRILRATAAAGATGVGPDAVPEIEASFLRQLDGLLYGDDPAQGFVLGRGFAHPVMRIAFVAPPGFTLTNSPQSILLNGPDGLRGEFGGGSLPRGGLPAYAQAILSAVVGTAPVQEATARDLRVNGIPAHVRQVAIATEQGSVVLSLAAYAAAGGEAYHFLMVSSPQREPQSAISKLFGSFRMLTPAEAATLRPRAIEVVSAGPNDTLRSLAARMATERPLERLLALNARNSAEPLRPGELIKLVVWR